MAPSATAQRAEITQHVFDDDGLPVLVANPVPDGGRGEVVAWRMCAPAVECQPVATDGDDDRSIEPGDVPAGTHLEVDVLADDGGSGDRDLLRLEACASASGRRCETLSAQGEDPPVCPGAAAVLGRRYTGWWVRAVDARVAADTAFAGVGYDLPRDIPLARPSRTTVRSRLVGPVLRARGAFAECAKPRIAILARARRAGGRRVFASVRCTSACDALTTRTRTGRRGSSLVTEVERVCSA